MNAYQAVNSYNAPGIGGPSSFIGDSLNERAYAVRARLIKRGEFITNAEARSIAQAELDAEDAA